MPSIECYLLEQDSVDDVSETIAYAEGDSNHYISTKVEDNFTKFQVAFYL
jgi:hypothetical protein